MTVDELIVKVKETIDTFLDSLLTEKVEPTPLLFNNQKFNDKLVAKFNNSDRQYTFLDRTKIVYCDDQEILGRWHGILKSSHDVVIKNEEFAADADNLYFDGSYIPNIKIGSRIAESMITRSVRLKNEIDKTQSLKLIDSYLDTLAENSAHGLKQRLNLQLVQLMLGGDIDSATGLKYRLDSPEGLHIKGDWSTPLTTIRKHIDTVATKFGENPNRITLGTPAYTALLTSTEFSDAYLQYRKDNQLRFKEYIESYRKTHADVEPTEGQILKYFAPSIIMNSVGMQIELDDAIYREKTLDGKVATKRVLPDNKILFSSSACDLDGVTIDYGFGVVLETIVANSIAKSMNLGEARFGPIGYFVANYTLNPPDVHAWSVVRGLPRLHNMTAFSSITID